MSFTDYWKEKAAKCRKSWAGKAKRFAERHAQLENIRKEVYLPLDYSVNFSFEDYKPGHFIHRNPIACWQDMNFCFSEDELRAALEAEGADMNSFRMSVSHQPIKGLEAPRPENEWEAYMKPNRVYDYDKMYRSWLQRMYEICTEVETIHLSYGQITMTIKRYSTEGMPFGYYELNPCEQLTKSAMLLQETDFYTLNVATLLMEAAAEWELRQEELNYYAKQLKIRKMEATTTDSIEFELWDDKKLQKKIQEYIGKDYQLDKILEQVLRPWQMAIKKYIDAVVERSLRENNIERWEPFCSSYSRDKFVEERLRPYLESVGLHEVELEVSGKENQDVILTYQGAKSRLSAQFQNFFFYPNSYYDGCFFDLKENTPLSAVTDYLKMMPALNQRMDETILKVLHIYDQQMQQNEKYYATVEQLEALAQQHAGKPVGKMMKYLRWEAGRLFNSRPLIPGMRLLNVLMIPTIKIVSDSAFSFVEEKRLNGNTVSQEEAIRWVDAECHNVFAFDPVTTDVKAWIANQQGVSTPKYKLGDFVHSFMPNDSKPFLSIDFIEQKL